MKKARKPTNPTPASRVQAWALRGAWGLLLGLLLAGAAAGLWLNRPLSLTQPVVELTVEPGRSPKAVARDWTLAGVDTPAWALAWWFRLSGDDRRIRAGSYALEPGVTPRGLLNKMVQGDESLESVTLVDGWTFKQVRAALAQAPGLRPTLNGLDDAAVMSALGATGRPAEGWFFPDTYRYGRGVSDLTVLRQAHRAMAQQLERAWAQRQPGLPLRSPEEALVLASIVEKETGRAADRGPIAGVFVNRLRLGMPLQTDPTVIYGLGEGFQGKLTRAHLRADTPFNTYTRRGLPPHAIALPGLAALQAATQPAATPALYFVARGDGSSQFSATLDEHNAAVRRYQLSSSP